MSDLRVAVLSMTRDRLAYSKHCFQTLRDNAGWDFDWYVLDQGSQDGTPEWLLDQDDLDVIELNDNIGICPGLNLLLDEACNPADYDVLVRFDNDAEVLQPDTLRVVCEVALEHQVIVAPRVLGLLHPPATLATLNLGDHTLDETAVLGGIFMAIPAVLFTAHGYRYDETHPPYAGDEAICDWFRRALGGHCGYLHGFEVNHHGAAVNERVAFPDYLERKTREMAA